MSAFTSVSKHANTKGLYIHTQKEYEMNFEMSEFPKINV